MYKLALTLTFITALLGKCSEDKYCAKCEGDLCSSCYQTYLNTDKVCTAPTTAVTNCHNYSNATTCSSCKIGYNLINNACTAPGLTDCLSSTGTGTAEVCLVCKDTYVPTAGKCDKATACSDSNCALCRVVGTVQTCGICKDDYLFLSLTATTCSKENVDDCLRENGSKKCL